MNRNIIKRISACAAITFGVIFSAMMLLNIWVGSVFPQEKRIILEKIMGTCGVMSASFIALLIVVKLAEIKNN